MVNEISDLIRDEIDCPKNNGDYYLSHDKLKHTILERVSLFFTRDLNQNRYGESDYGVVPPFTNRDMDVILNKKEDKLLNYKKCDEYWLVIREGDMLPASFANINLKEVKSSFDKIFMYRIFNNTLVTLKS